MGNYWNILNPGGVKLSCMYHVNDSLLVRLLRKIGLAAQYGTRIVVLDQAGEPIMKMTKPFTFGLFSASVFDKDGLLGSVTEEKMGLEGRRYVLRDWAGVQRGQLEGDWRSYSLQMKDPRGATLGVISRKAEQVNKVIFSEMSAYYVVHLYVDQEDRRWRKFLLTASAAIALLLR